MRKVLVIPLSTKMRNRVKQYGKVWITLGFDGERTHLRTLEIVHAGGHPYETWVSPKEAKLELVK